MFAPLTAGDLCIPRRLFQLEIHQRNGWDYDSSHSVKELLLYNKALHCPLKIHQLFIIAHVSNLKHKGHKKLSFCFANHSR